MIRTLKSKVEYVLKHYPESRNSDIILTIGVWKQFNSSLIRAGTEGDAVYLKDLVYLPREDNIKRVRAVIQNRELRLLPTSDEVRIKRGISEEQWREYLKNN